MFETAKTAAQLTVAVASTIQWGVANRIDERRRQKRFDAEAFRITEMQNHIGPYNPVDLPVQIWA